MEDNKSFYSDLPEAATVTINMVVCAEYNKKMAIIYNERKLPIHFGKLTQAVLSYVGTPGCAYKNKTKEDVLKALAPILLYYGSLYDYLGYEHVAKPMSFDFEDEDSNTLLKRYMRTLMICEEKMETCDNAENIRTGVATQFYVLCKMLYLLDIGEEDSGSVQNVFDCAYLEIENTCKLQEFKPIKDLINKRTFDLIIETSKSERKSNLEMGLKLMEEVGEFIEALDNEDKSSIIEEAADCIIVALSCIGACKIPVENAYSYSDFCKIADDKYIDEMTYIYERYTKVKSFVYTSAINILRKIEQPDINSVGLYHNIVLLTKSLALYIYSMGGGALTLEAILTQKIGKWIDKSIRVPDEGEAPVSDSKCDPARVSMNDAQSKKDDKDIPKK